MQRWLRRIRGAIGMGLTWAVGWVLFGLVIGVVSILVPGLVDVFFEYFDAPLPALAIPGFIGGALFSTVLGIAGRRTRFDELSLPRFTFWGALGGLLLGLIPAVPIASGAAGTTLAYKLLVAAAIGAPCALLGAASAAVTLALARRAEDRHSLDAATVADVGLTEAERRELLGGGS